MQTDNMKNKLLVFGADGLAKQVLPFIKHDNTYFFDDYNKNPNSFGQNSITSWDDIDESFKYQNYIICLGNPKHRLEISEKLLKLGMVPYSIHSENTFIYTTNIDEGCIILDQVLVEYSAKVGTGVLLNHGAKIFHDVTIGDYSEIMPGATILGGAQIGSMCRIGSNATILPKIKIGEGAIIGAGAVVTKDILPHTINVGIPSSIIKQL